MGRIHELYAIYQDQILESPQKPVCDDTDFLMLKKRVMGGVSTKKFLVFSCLYRLRHLRERYDLLYGGTKAASRYQ